MLLWLQKIPLLLQKSLRILRLRRPPSIPVGKPKANRSKALYQPLADLFMGKGKVQCSNIEASASRDYCLYVPGSIPGSVPASPYQNTFGTDPETFGTDPGMDPGT